MSMYNYSSPFLLDLSSLTVSSLHISSFLTSCKEGYSKSSQIACFVISLREPSEKNSQNYLKAQKYEVKYCNFTLYFLHSCLNNGSGTHALEQKRILLNSSNLLEEKKVI